MVPRAMFAFSFEEIHYFEVVSFLMNSDNIKRGGVIDFEKIYLEKKKRVTAQLNVLSQLIL